MQYFVGVLDGGKDLWGVRIPDIDGCVGAGKTPEEAIAEITEALRAVAQHRKGADVALPSPRSIDQVISAGEIESGETAVLIPLILDSGRSVRANLTFDAGLLDAIDSEAARRGVTRSAFLASAARDKIEGRF